MISKRLEAIYDICLHQECDINKLFPTLRQYASECEHVTEFGTRGVFSTYAFIAAQPKTLLSYDLQQNTNIYEAIDVAKENDVNLKFLEQNVLTTTIEETDLLFIDTLHVYRQLSKELALHGNKARKYILLHDTTTWGTEDEIEDGTPKQGLQLAIKEFLIANPRWIVEKEITESNGLMILKRKIETLKMTTSIIIPTYKHPIKPCIDNVLQNTNLKNIEIIVVMNGCPPETKAYIESLQSAFIRTVEFPEPIGYTRAINVGLRTAKGEYLVLLNDDVTILGPTWLQMLQGPFLSDTDTGITGPVKFTFDCGGILRTSIAFWCCMFKKALIQEIGYLSEAYNPGMGEDGDFSIKAKLLGYKLVQVPVDKAGVFGEGPTDTGFPVYHVGSGTFQGIDGYEDIKARNIAVLEKTFANRMEKIYEVCHHHENAIDFNQNFPGGNVFYDNERDINELFPVLRRYANRCEHITEFGVLRVFSTYAFMSTLPKVLRSYDVNSHGNVQEAYKVAGEFGVDFKFLQQDSITSDIEETDLLFIDTLHTYHQLSLELRAHNNKVRKYIILHDTVTYGNVDDVGGSPEGKQGLQPAIREFLSENSQWILEKEILESNGLMILKRVPKFSIIVPSCDKDESTLIPGIDKILAYTNLTDKEVIVVANGCGEKTLDYLSSLRRRVTTINMGPCAGQVAPVNAGSAIAQGQYVVLIDDDTHLLEQGKDNWINQLYGPFKKTEIAFPGENQVGVTGVFVAGYPFIGEAMHSGCAMYRGDLWKKVGGFDPEFGFGYLCDADVSLRIKALGYSIVPVGLDGAFPLYHPYSAVDTQIKKEKVALMRKNREILYTRHWKKPVYSVVVPTYNHLEDLLKPCLESIKHNTDFSTVDIEIIVVANGCIDGTADYVDSLGFPFKLVWFDEGLGYTIAANEGIKVAKGEYVILMNNDIVLLDWGLPKNTWINMLVAPMLVDEKVGLTGPLELYDSYADRRILIFFLVCIRRKLFDEIGLLDTAYAPGGGEDVAFSVEAQNAGYKQVVVPDNNISQASGNNVGSFPVWHHAEGTFSAMEFPEYGNKIIKINGLRNMVRYNKHIKLNLGSGGVEVPGGYISVDKFDKRASILMDVCDLELPDNSVEEILASHLFEHLSPYKVSDILEKWLKVLKPGGKLIMEMPNIEELCKAYATMDKDGKYGILNTIFGAVNTGNDEDKNNIVSPHLFGWAPDLLWDHLMWAGFRDVVFLPEQIPHPPFSGSGPSIFNMRVECYKPI